MRLAPGGGEDEQAEEGAEDGAGGAETGRHETGEGDRKQDTRAGEDEETGR